MPADMAIAGFVQHDGHCSRTMAYYPCYMSPSRRAVPGSIKHWLQACHCIAAIVAAC